jgi:hypothetical protein
MKAADVTERDLSTHGKCDDVNRQSFLRVALITRALHLSEETSERGNGGQTGVPRNFRGQELTLWSNDVL